MTDLQGCAFLETTKAIYRHLLKCMDQNFLLWHTLAITSPLHVFLNACETQRKQVGVGPSAAPDESGKDVLRSNLRPPQAGARSVLPQHNLQEPENFCKLCQLAQASRATLLAKNHLNAAAHWILPSTVGLTKRKKVYFILANIAHTGIST